MGAVGKSVVEYEDEKRPADDHSRTGLNAALKEPVLTLRVPTGSIAIVILGTRSRSLSRLRGACAPRFDRDRAITVIDGSVSVGSP